MLLSFTKINDLSIFRVTSSTTILQVKDISEPKLSLGIALTTAVPDLRAVITVLFPLVVLRLITSEPDTIDQVAYVLLNTLLVRLLLSAVVKQLNVYVAPGYNVTLVALKYNFLIITVADAVEQIKKALN